MWVVRRRELATGPRCNVDVPTQTGYAALLRREQSLLMAERFDAAKPTDS